MTTLDPKMLASACATAAKAHAKLPLKDGRLDAGDLRELVEGVSTLEELTALAEPGEATTSFALMLIARDALPAPRAKEKTLRFDELRLHHGDLVVPGKLALVEDLWITGNLDVKGVIETTEDASLYVAGNVTAPALAWMGPRGHVYVGGDLLVKELVTLMESVLVVCGAIVTPFLNVSAIGGHVNAPKSKRKVKHWIGTDEAMENGAKVRARMKAFLAPDLFKTADADDETLQVMARAWKRVVAGKSIWARAK